MVNWKNGVRKIYLVFVVNICVVGVVVVKFLEMFRNKYGVKMENVYVIGYSFGV